MIQDQCISITDLRKNTKACLKDLNKGEKYVFVNNKPIAVIMDINLYEELPQLIELPKAETTPEILSMAKEAEEMDISEFDNI